MIITCPNCNKQFKIDNSLIPDEGRDLQCGSCNHIWFYNIQEKNNEVLELKQEIISEDIETKAENKEDKIEEKQQPEEIIKTEINNKKKEKNSEKQENTTILIKTEIEVLAIGIGHDVSRYYNRAIKITDVNELGDVMISQLSTLFDKKNKFH